MDSTNPNRSDAAHPAKSGTRTALAYLAWDRWFRRLAAGTQGAADGFFLGFASDDTLDRLDEQYYLRTPYYRTEAFNQRGLFEWEREAIERHFPPKGRVVVIGAGAGREVVALNSFGYEAVGYEPHETLATYGQSLLERSGSGSEIRSMTRSQWPKPQGPVDGVIVGWGVYHSIRTRRARVEFLSAMRQTLDDGTPVLLSFFIRRGSPLYIRTLARVGTTARRLHGRPPVELGDVLAPFLAHQFSDGEVENELATAGFRLVESGDDGYGWAVAVADAGNCYRRGQ